MIRLKEKLNFCPPPLGRWTLLAVCLLCLWAERASALGTPAGTAISSTATVAYTLGSDPTPLSLTVSASFDVQEVLDVTVTWQDTANVAVNTPHIDGVLTFLLTNTGNGPEDFLLSINDVLGGDQFDPGVQQLWIESNGTAGLQPDDTLYPATGVSLAADADAVIYVASSIPAGLTNSDIGTVQLAATAQTPGAAGQTPGSFIVGAGFNNVDAVVGTTSAEGDAMGAYEISAVGVALTKSIARIIDLNGGDRPYTGARVTYRVVVDVSGSGMAEALVVTDTIPGDMTYVAGSSVLNGVSLTDGADADQGDFNVSAANTVTIHLNDTVAPATHTIEFATTIN